MNSFKFTTVKIEHAMIKTINHDQIPRNIVISTRMPMIKPKNANSNANATTTVATVSSPPMES